MHQRPLLFDRLAILFFSIACIIAALMGGCARATEPSVAESLPQESGPADPRDASKPKEVPEATAGEVPVMPPQKLAVDHLPNAYQIHPKVISGGLPEGDPAFAELASLGVKTVISVDGAKPDVEIAKKYGLQYVHLPHGYDGVPELRAKELAKAVRDLKGPIYIHCHHGKHRSPAAAAVACVSAGLVSPEGAKTILQAAGTSPKYRGLYQSAESARVLEGRLLDELDAEFPETAPIPPMAEAMIEIEHAHDHLNALADNAWQPLPKHPDLDPAHEALLLGEHFTELMRTEAARTESEGFRKLLAEGEAAAQLLEDALQLRRSDKSPTTEMKANAALEVVNKNCAACHQTYRDVPLSEKTKK